MIKSKLLLVPVLALSLSACTCRSHTKPSDVSSIPDKDSDGPIKPIYFAFDSYKLDSAATSTLKANTEWLKANPATKFIIEGNCDERGTNEYNMVLGQSRARAALNFFRNAGIDASRMSTISYGEERPVDPGHTEEAWAKNRRDAFRISQ
jgi:peptidoglycan-associated lipoprotein